MMMADSAALILIVDDTLNNLEVMSETLSAAGYEVAIATSGERALQQLKRRTPDLILLDVMMPGIDGFETCRRLKSNPRTRDIPVIFMTALVDVESKVKGLDLGAVDYITKPFRTSEVLGRVKNHLKLRQLSRDLEIRNMELQQLAEQLEQRLIDLKATQEELIKSEKMAALGQLTASVAHEINTPLSVIRGASANMAVAFDQMLQQLPALLQCLMPQQQAEFLAWIKQVLQNQISLSTREERQLRQQLKNTLVAQGVAEAEQMATQLTLLGLGPDLQAYQFILDHPHGQAILQVAHHLVLQQQSTRNIQQEVNRAAKIVFALKTYGHYSDAGEKVRAKITDGIEVALTLYQNQIDQGIEVIRHYQETASILCNPDELTQVWVNLIDNALYALSQPVSLSPDLSPDRLPPDRLPAHLALPNPLRPNLPPNTLEIEVSQQGDWMVVNMTDSGCGIPVEVQSRVFDPFFTTKPRGEGSGLGLDIVQQIIAKHAGEIQVRSQPGQTTVTVRLPIGL